VTRPTPPFHCRTAPIPGLTGWVFRTILPEMSAWWVASYVVLWLLVLALCVLVVALARQIGTLHLRLAARGALEIDEEGPPLAEAPQPAEAEDLRGGRHVVGGPGRPSLLLFVSPGCSICADVIPGLPAAARAFGHPLRPLVVADAAVAEARVVYPDGTAERVPVIADPALSAAYRVPGTPYAVVLDGLGVVRAKGTVNDLEQLEGLVETARRRLTEPIHAEAAFREAAG
jgi:methylamine dehydrogenase accessory protein MauD